VPSASSGGGCASNGPIRVCISASGGNLEPDIYITSSYSACEDTSLSLVNSSGATLETVDVGCGVGHYGPFPYAGVNGQTYTATADMHATSGGFLALSPSEKFSH
jgi:hypothetical protein